MSESIWHPDPEQLMSTRVADLMTTVGMPIDPEDVGGSVRRFVRWSQQQPERFWPAVLDDLGVVWSRGYSQVVDLSDGPEWADWFPGGETNIAMNCVDIPAAQMPDDLALVAEDEEGNSRRWNFSEADREIQKLAQLLSQLGIERGDRIACLMPMVGEVVFAMLATMKVGAVFIPIFSGYAPPSVRERLEDSGARLLFTADVGNRRGRRFDLKWETSHKFRLSI